MLKQDFKDWMKDKSKNPKLHDGSAEAYIMYLNGLFVMLQENDFISYNAWSELDKAYMTNYKMINDIIQDIYNAIDAAEKSSKDLKLGMKNFKSTFNKLNKYIEYIQTL